MTGENSILGRGNSMYKGPEAGRHVTYLMDKTRDADTQKIRQRVREMK